MHCKEDMVYLDESAVVGRYRDRENPVSVVDWLDLIVGGHGSVCT